MTEPTNLPTAVETPLFRAEATAYHRTRRTEGQLLRIAPTWTQWTYGWVLAFAVSAAAFVIFAPVREYATARIVIRLAGHVGVHARASGVIARLEVSPGQHVQEGAPLLTLDAAELENDRERLVEELAAASAQFLQQPGDASARSTVGRLRAELRETSAELRRRTIPAPHAGVVAEVRVRAGQAVHLGDEVATLVQRADTARVVAIVPARHRPLLQPGLPLRVRFDGLRYAYEEVTIDAVGEEAIGPTEVRRYLGTDLGDALELSGPVVLVHATLPDREVRSDDLTLFVYDGMLGEGRIALRKEPILFALVPGLRALFSGEFP